MWGKQPSILWLQRRVFSCLCLGYSSYGSRHSLPYDCQNLIFAPFSPLCLSVSSLLFLIRTFDTECEWTYSCNPVWFHLKIFNYIWSSPFFQKGHVHMVPVLQHTFQRASMWNNNWGDIWCYVVATKEKKRRQRKLKESTAELIRQDNYNEGSIALITVAFVGNPA